MPLKCTTQSSFSVKSSVFTHRITQFRRDFVECGVTYVSALKFRVFLRFGVINDILLRLAKEKEQDVLS